MTTRTFGRGLAATIALGSLALAACSDDSGNSKSADSTAAATSAAAETTVTSAPATTEFTAQPWEEVVAPADCQCSDASEFKYFIREADPNKVLFFLEGGGACFSAETCGPESETYKKKVGNGQMDRADGIFDFANPENPFADWSIVYVPYCTGDVHIGNATTDYGNGVVVQHKGYVNGSTALQAMAERFPGATEVVVAGESAGSVATPLYAGLTHDLLPDALIKVVADGSGAYPDVPAVNAFIGTQWGTMNAVPDWPESAGVTPEEWSLPGLFVQAGKHAPDIVFARHDYAYDQTQAAFSQLAGVGGDELVKMIDLNEQQIEAGGVELWSYISPGDNHTVLGKPEFYSETLDGMRLVAWVQALIDGDTVADWHCTECTTA